MERNRPVRSSDRVAGLLLPIGWSAVLSAMLLRLVWFLHLRPDDQVTMVPDDAFYYLVLARNFAQLGTWTFDGHAPATGFHPLLAYLIAAVYWCWPQISDAVLIGGIAAGSTLLLGAAGYLVARTVQRDFGAVGVLGVLLVFGADVALQQQSLLVESTLPIFVSSALLALFSRGSADGSPRAGPWAGALALGVLGTLSRSDFGLFPACCAIALGCVGLRVGRGSRALGLALTATAGAALGVILVSLHTFYWSGSLIQSSARMKQHWGALVGYDAGPFVRLLIRLLAGHGNRWSEVGTESGLVVLLGLTGALVGFQRHSARTETLCLAAGAALTLLGYCVFYGENSAAVQIWYLGNVIAPAAYVFGAMASFIDRRALGTALALCSVSLLHNTWVSLRPIWPHQRVMKEAGEYLRRNPDLQGVGAWNAGLIAHFSGREVVNLDGLVNDDIYAYVEDDRLLDYVCLRELRFVVDFSAMLDDPDLARRGGYTDGRLRAVLSPQAELFRGDSGNRWRDSALAFYSVDDRGCRGTASNLGRRR